MIKAPQIIFSSSAEIAAISIGAFLSDIAAGMLWPVAIWRAMVRLK